MAPINNRMGRPDIHGYDLSLRGAYWAIERSSMIPENKEAIRGSPGP